MYNTSFTILHHKCEHTHRHTHTHKYTIIILIISKYHLIILYFPPCFIFTHFQQHFFSFFLFFIFFLYITSSVHSGVFICYVRNVHTYISNQYHTNTYIHVIHNISRRKSYLKKSFREKKLKTHGKEKKLSSGIK